jgi:nucleotide-binding universal stress UspA family protein
MLTIARILAPTDFTESSDRAVDYAVELAERLGASVTVMHAYEIPIVGIPDGALIATAEVAAKIAMVSKDALDRVVARCAASGVTVDGALREGVAYEEIVRVADELNADLIVVGTHGRRGIARALLGSVAENVIRTTLRPVLAIHYQPTDERGGVRTSRQDATRPHHA